MSAAYNSMDLFKALPKTNCRDCGAANCLAFSVLAFKGEKKVSDCPYLSAELIQQFTGAELPEMSPPPGPEELLESLKSHVATVDLEQAAKKTQGEFKNNKLTLKILGKNVSVDSACNFYTELHVNPWIVIPILSYIITCKGKELSGKWVPFRELDGGKDRFLFFEHRCEKPLKKLADTYTDLFEDMMDLFNGIQVENHYQSDISLILKPLPRVPILICYWKPDDGLDSELNLFFDSTAEDNLDIEAINSLGTGLATMFEKISHRHG